MSKSIFVLCLVSLFWVSCDSSNQYDVYAINHGNSDLILSFKSLQDKDGSEERQITLKPNESRKIISTVNIPTGIFKSPSSEECTLVAEYVRATTSDSKISTLEWCSDRIQFSHTDIGQGEFTIEYTNLDFP